MSKKPIRVLIIPAEGEWEIKELPQDLRTLQATVGGYIEAVPVAFDSDGDITAMAWCNEEGKIHGLPVNHRATAFWWALCDEMRGRDSFSGTVIMTGGADGAGDMLPLPDRLEKIWLYVNG